tara:strand:- start:615 stop:2399 length:1785 start_codon:yes stop_codon:yes gene_type:complete
MKKILILAPIILFSILFYIYMNINNNNFNTENLSNEPNLKNESLILPGLALPENQRKYIWDIEQKATELNSFGLKNLKKVLQTKKMKDLSLLLMNDFNAQVPDSNKEINFVDSYFKSTKLESSDLKYELLDKASFLKWISNKSSDFIDEPKVKIKFSKLEPVNRNNYDGFWKIKLKINVSGKSDFGYSEDNYIFLTEIKKPEPVFVSNGNWIKSVNVLHYSTSSTKNFLMTDNTSDFGIDISEFHDNWESPANRTIPNTGGVYSFDYNKDGYIDLLIDDVTHYRGFILYKGTREGVFKNSTDEVKLPPLQSPSLVAIADLDNDGWEDIVIGPGLIFKNNFGENFVNVSRNSNLSKLGNLRETQNFSSISVADYDRDGLVDLYICRSSPNPDGGSWINGKMEDNYETQLLKNKGNFIFEDVTKKSNASGEKRSVFTTVFSDFNNDFWPDIYLIHEFGNGVLLLNDQKGKFEKIMIAEFASDFGSMGLASGDFNNDKNIDIYVSSMYSSAGTRVISNLKENSFDKKVMLELKSMVRGSQLYSNLGELKFEKMADKYNLASVGWGYGPIMSDLNNDSWLDIYTTSGFVSRNRDKPDG